MLTASVSGSPFSRKRETAAGSALEAGSDLGAARSVCCLSPFGSFSDKGKRRGEWGGGGAEFSARREPRVSPARRSRLGVRVPAVSWEIAVRAAARTRVGSFKRRAQTWASSSQCANTSVSGTRGRIRRSLPCATETSISPVALRSASRSLIVDGCSVSPATFLSRVTNHSLPATQPCRASR
jgi:hypothetical protein